MDSYDYRTRQNTRNDRFPREAQGYAELSDWLREAKEDWDPPTRVEPPRPRIFVSHKKDDEDLAEDVAQAADAAGFWVWFDALDPGLAAVQQLVAQATLPPGSAVFARAIAALVEMGLLNSTHIVVVYTNNTRASRWVPYELGRAKQHFAVLARNACLAIERASVNVHDTRQLAEFYHLVDQVATRRELDTWLAAAMNEWCARTGQTLPGGAAGRWPQMKRKRGMPP